MFDITEIEKQYSIHKDIEILEGILVKARQILARANDEFTKEKTMKKTVKTLRSANQEVSDTSYRRIREIKFIEWSLRQSGVGHSMVNCADHCKLYNDSVVAELRLTDGDRGGIISNLNRDGWLKKLKSDGKDGSGKCNIGYTHIQFTAFAYSEIQNPSWVQIRINRNKNFEADCSKISKKAREDKAVLANKSLVPTTDNIVPTTDNIVPTTDNIVPTNDGGILFETKSVPKTKRSQEDSTKEARFKMKALTCLVNLGRKNPELLDEINDKMDEFGLE